MPRPMSDKYIADNLVRFHERRKEANKWAWLHILSGLPLGISFAHGRWVLGIISLGAFFATMIIHSRLRLPDRVFLERLAKEGYIAKCKHGNYQVTYKGELYNQRRYDEYERNSYQ